MSNFSADNLLLTLPRPLKEDSGMNPLGETAAKALEAVWANVSLPNIYARIDSLPEWLLDVLAKDLKVDWYDYECELEQKRRLIKDSFYVHRHMGTKGAIERAVSDVWPYTTIEEWFEYGGSPYYFRILMSAQNPAPPLALSEVISLVDEYKSLRSHLEGVYYYSPHDIVIGTHFSYVLYRHRMSGTYPDRRRYGGIEAKDIVIETAKGGTAYDNPHTGELYAGTWPQRATEGDINEDGIVIDTDKGGLAYGNPYAGEVESGVFPEEAEAGDINDGGIIVKTAGSVSAYNHIETGDPGDGGGILANTAAGDMPYSVRYCGSPLDLF